MFCNTENCQWRGELTAVRSFQKEGITYCGLCTQPASETGQVTRRDVDAESQDELVEDAAREFQADAEESWEDI